MSGLVPLADLAAMRFADQTHFGFAEKLGWIALNDSEFHLSAHHLPLAVRVLGGSARLGALLDPAFLARPAADRQGRWQNGYMPIALRTFPFVLMRPDAPRPIDEIGVIAAAAGGRIGLRGVPIAADVSAGALGPEMTAIRNTLQMMRVGAQRLSEALDLLAISNVLVPLAAPDGTPSVNLTVDPARFAALEAGALAGLASRSFLPLDLAAAIAFSRRHLDVARLPLADAAAPAQATETPATRADPMDFVLANLEAMNFALDTSDLFDIASTPIDWGECAPPPPPALAPEEQAA